METLLLREAAFAGSCFPTLDFVKDGAPTFVRIEALLKQILRSAQGDTTG